MESEDGWVKISTRKDIEQIDFEVEEFYVTEDLETAKAKRLMIDEAFEAKKTEKKASKAAKAAKKTTKNKEVVTQEAVTQE
jgi:uncharacterized protein YdaU (DUF1376 family)